MRLFVAIALPEHLRARLTEWARRGELPGARFVPRENLHLTLRFLGEVAPSDRPRLDSALAATVSPLEPPELRIARSGMLPPRGKARVAHLALAADERLTALQMAVSAACEANLDLPAERRRFRPHVTLARCRAGWNRATRRAWEGRRGPSEAAGFTVTYVDLMKSELRPSGARYRVMESFHLRG